MLTKQENGAPSAGSKSTTSFAADSPEYIILTRLSLRGRLRPGFLSTSAVQWRGGQDMDTKEETQSASGEQTHIPASQQGNAHFKDSHKRLIIHVHTGVQCLETIKLILTLLRNSF